MFCESNGLFTLNTTIECSGPTRLHLDEVKYGVFDINLEKKSYC